MSPSVRRGAEGDDDPCWEGYEQYGTKEKDGKEVPNCVPKDAMAKQAVGNFEGWHDTEYDLGAEGAEGEDDILADWVTFERTHPQGYEDMLRHLGEGLANLDDERDYEGMRAYQSIDESAGFVISPDNEIKWVASIKPGMGKAAMRAAIEEGGEWLSCFDGFLPEFYERFGFEVVKREPNWTEGEPDVVWMALPGTPSYESFTRDQAKEAQILPALALGLGMMAPGAPTSLTDSMAQGRAIPAEMGLSDRQRHQFDNAQKTYTQLEQKYQKQPQLLKTFQTFRQLAFDVAGTEPQDQLEMEVRRNINRNSPLLQAALDGVAAGYAQAKVEQLAPGQGRGF